MLDYLGVLRSLNEARVRYVIAGGVAVNLHGVPRMTYDLDLLVDLEAENLGRLVALFEKWGFRPRAPVPLDDLAKTDRVHTWIAEKGRRAFCVTNPEWALSEIDVLLDTPVDFARAARNAVTVRLADSEVPVVSIADLIEMKRGTGRAQDETDIRYLQGIDEEEAE